MAYSNPSITASGTTFAQLQSGGASGILDRLIGTNSFTASQLNLLRGVKNGHLSDVYRQAARAITAYTQGDPILTKVIAEARLKDMHTVFSALATLCAESGVLIDANAGTLGTAATPIGTRKAVRTF